MELKAWDGFTRGKWSEEVNVRDFIQCNYTPYEGDGSFLAPATSATENCGKRYSTFPQKKKRRAGC